MKATRTIVTGLSELRIKSDLAILGASEANMSIRYTHFKMVLTDNNGSKFIHHSEIFNSSDYPIIRDNVRQDIFETFNGMFTNLVNNSLKRVRSLILVNGGTISTAVQNLDNYNDDLVELRTLAKRETYIDAVLDKLLNIRSVTWSEDDLNALKAKAKYYTDKNNDVTTLCFSTDYNVIILSLPTIHNERLASGESMFVNPKACRNILGLDDNFYIESETILVTQSDIYLMVPLKGGFSLSLVKSDKDL